jgi:putative serine protease PepD
LPLQAGEFQPQATAPHAAPQPQATAQASSQFSYRPQTQQERQQAAHPQLKQSKLQVLAFGTVGVVVGAAIVFSALFLTGNLNKNSGSSTSASAIGVSNTVADSNETLAEQVAKKCLPSVVSVRAYGEVGNQQLDLFSELFGDNGGNGGGGGSGGGNDSESTEEPLSLGSGVAIDNKHILTNQHVVAEGTKFVVTFDNGETAEAKLVAKDESTDLAVLEVNVEGLVPIQVAGLDTVNVGEWVMAIGSPFGQEQSVSTGIVSAKYRSQTMQSASGVTFYTNMIQTDAAINPGNSGGALVNDKGELIGINSLINSTSGSASGVGFAIPADHAVNVANQLINGGKVTHPYLGVTLATVDAASKSQLETSADSGAYVSSVVKGSPAAKAEMKKGDIIQEFNGKKISTAAELIIAVREAKVGDEVTIKVLRGDKTEEIKVALGEDSD